MIISNTSNKDKTITNVKLWSFDERNKIQCNFERKYSCSSYDLKNKVKLSMFDIDNFCDWINETDSSSFFYIDIYHDNENNIYAIKAGKNCIKSINYKSKKLYKAYEDIILKNKKDNYYTSIAIYIFVRINVQK